jgi:hypothetical protein
MFCIQKQIQGDIQVEYTGFTLAAVDGKKPKGLSSEGMGT